MPEERPQDEETRRRRFEEARMRYDAAAAALARSDGKVDEQMLLDDEMVIIAPATEAERKTIEVYDYYAGMDGNFVLEREPGETDEEYAERSEFFRRLFGRPYTGP